MRTDNSRVIHVTGGSFDAPRAHHHGRRRPRGGSGAGILIDATAALTIINSTVAGNHADASGGGIHNDGLLTLNNVLVAANTAGVAAAVCSIRASGTANLTNTTIYGNYSDFASGGGMGNNGTATLTNVTITGNAAGLAGGITNGGTADLTLTNSIVAGNDATGQFRYRRISAC